LFITDCHPPHQNSPQFYGVAMVWSGPLDTKKVGQGTCLQYAGNIQHTKFGDSEVK
jgi:hypothetical protein